MDPKGAAESIKWIQNEIRFYLWAQELAQELPDGKYNGESTLNLPVWGPRTTNHSLAES